MPKVIEQHAEGYSHFDIYNVDLYSVFTNSCNFREFMMATVLHCNVLNSSTGNGTILYEEKENFRRLKIFDSILPVSLQVEMYKTRTKFA